MAIGFSVGKKLAFDMTCLRNTESHEIEQL